MEKTRAYSSPGYNYLFDTENGNFARWGNTLDDDPQSAPFPEILDIEVTTICKGPRGKLCPACYKANSPRGKNMTMDTFVKIMDRMKPEKGLGIMQCAIGADAQATANPVLFGMMRHCRKIGVVPNITVADIDMNTASELAHLCGAVAVSRYADKNPCYDSIKLLVDEGLKQVNMHILLEQTTFNDVLETIQDYHNDPRLKGLNAIVLLSLKQKGRGANHIPLTQGQFQEIVDLALGSDTPIGFDSCSAHKFLASIKGHPDEARMTQLSEPCESVLFSSYCSVDGEFYPCSFTEEYPGWERGIPILDYRTFDEVWNHPRTEAFRADLLAKGRHCPLYNI